MCQLVCDHSVHELVQPGLKFNWTSCFSCVVNYLVSLSPSCLTLMRPIAPIIGIMVMCLCGIMQHCADLQACGASVLLCNSEERVSCVSHGHLGNGLIYYTVCMLWICKAWLDLLVSLKAPTFNIQTNTDKQQTNKHKAQIKWIAEPSWQERTCQVVCPPMHWRRLCMHVCLSNAFQKIAHACVVFSVCAVACCLSRLWFVVFAWFVCCSLSRASLSSLSLSLSLSLFLSWSLSCLSLPHAMDTPAFGTTKELLRLHWSKLTNKQTNKHIEWEKQSNKQSNNPYKQTQLVLDK